MTNNQLKYGNCKLCAVITSYNPSVNFEQTLAQISKQVDKIVIVDNNSEERIKDSFHTFSDDSKIHIIFNSTNCGVATALNQGILWAKENAYNWLLLLDQDSGLPDNFVEDLFRIYQQAIFKEQIAIIGPKYFDIESSKHQKQAGAENNNTFDEVKHLITSGSLISMEVFNKIGMFQDELFIDFVDIEFCLRARRNGYKIIQVPSILMQHRIGAVSMHKLPWKTTGTSNHAPMRRYFMMRNNIIVAKKYFAFDPAWAINSLIIRFKSVFLLCLFEDQKRLKLKYILLGLIDGIFRKVNRKVI